MLRLPLFQFCRGRRYSFSKTLLMCNCRFPSLRPSSCRAVLMSAQIPSCSVGAFLFTSLSEDARWMKFPQPPKRVSAAYLQNLTCNNNAVPFSTVASEKAVTLHSTSRGKHFARTLPPPSAPDPMECCGSGCEKCVWLVYIEEMLAWTRKAGTEGEEERNKVILYENRFLNMLFNIFRKYIAALYEHSVTNFRISSSFTHIFISIC